MTLRLVSCSFDLVELEADFGDGVCRAVRVDVQAGRDWYAAVQFPNLSNASGESLGDDELDRQVRERAGEELVRLDAAANLARGRWAA